MEVSEESPIRSRNSENGLYFVIRVDDPRYASLELKPLEPDELLTLPLNRRPEKFVRVGRWRKPFSQSGLVDYASTTMISNVSAI